MKPETLRTFAAGLLVAATVCGAVYLLGPKETKTATKAEPLSTEEMKTELASSGHVVLTEQEWSDQLAAAGAAVKEVSKEEPKEEEQPKEEEKPKEDTSDKVVYRTILTVSSGMTSIDVGRALQNANIIENSRDFFNEVEKRGLSNELRPGSFEVESGMSMDQLISVIFK